MYSASTKNDLDYNNAYQMARQRILARQLFYVHFVIYLLVSLGMVAIYQFTTPGGYPWFIWPVGGWGLGILIHFAITRAIGRPNYVKSNKIEAEMERMGYK